MLKICNNSKSYFGSSYKIFGIYNFDESLGLESLSPGTLTKDVVQVQGDGLFLNQGFNFSFKISRQDSHQGLGGKPVLGSLLVITLGHVIEHQVSGLVDVMDNLAKIALEVLGSQSLKIRERRRRDVSLPLEVTLASLNVFPHPGVLIHEGLEGSGNLEVLGGNGALARGRKSHSGLLLSLNNLPGGNCGLSHVASKDDEIEILVDVVHDLGLEESLGSVIHDLVAELRLGNVLPELLDASASSLLGAIKVNDLVSIILCGNTILHLSNKLLDNLKLSSEKGVLGLVHDILVSLEDSGIEAGDSLNETLVAGGDLELLEETGHDTGRGGAGEANLVIDDDRGVDAGADQGVHHDVKVSSRGAAELQTGTLQ